jgi:hypothetical protein
MAQQQARNKARSFEVEKRVYEKDAEGNRRLLYPAGAKITREQAEAAGLVEPGTSEDDVSDKARQSRSSGASKKTAAAKKAEADKSGE